MWLLADSDDAYDSSDLDEDTLESAVSKLIEDEMNVRLNNTSPRFSPH